MTRLSVEEVAQITRQCVDERRPLSAIRLGDGESRMMGWPEFTPTGMVVQQMMYWFYRMDFTGDDILRLAMGVKQAIREADILGLPRQEQVKANAEYAKVLQYVTYYALDDHGPQIANCSFHRELQEQKLFDELLNGLDRVYLITCHDVALSVEKYFGLETIRIPVPIEGQIGRQPTNHWPARFREIRRQLDTDLSGELFLVGASLLGKSYCAMVKRAGGVALDIGSVFDGWAGVMSRSYLHGKQEIYGL